MSNAAVLAIKVIADTRQAQTALDESASKTSKWSSGIGKASAVATVGLAAVGAVMVSGVRAAAEDAQAQALLAKALTNSAGATKSQVAETEDWITKTTLATGVADDKLRPALANLVRATGDVAQSQKAMSLALDISAATGKDVEAVSAALAKGYGGQTTALGRLVPGMDQAILKSGDMNAITAELARTTGGSAAAAAGTAAGQYQIFQTAIAETKEGIGAALLPVLTQLMGAMSGVSKWAANNTGTLTVLLGVFAGLAAIIVVVNAVTKAAAAAQAIYQGALIAVRVAVAVYTATQWLLNAALAANPIGLVIIAIALLAAGIVLAWKKSETFREVVTGAFRAVQSAISAVVDWVRSTLGPVFDRVLGDIGSAMRTLGGIASTVWTGIKVVIDGVVSAIESVISAVGRAISAIRNIKVPHIPDLNPFTASAPTSAVAGSRATFRGVARAPAAARGTTGGGGVSITVQGALDPEGVARQISRILGAHDVRMGRTVVAP